jgi:hypothetical protein
MTAIRRTSDFNVDPDSLIEHLMFGDVCLGCIISPPTCQGIPYATLKAAWPRYKGKVLREWTNRGYDRDGSNPWGWTEFGSWSVEE